MSLFTAFSCSHLTSMLCMFVSEDMISLKHCLNFRVLLMYLTAAVSIAIMDKSQSILGLSDWPFIGKIDISQLAPEMS